jgi:hypothetical protein
MPLAAFHANGTTFSDVIESNYPASKHHMPHLARHFPQGGAAVNLALFHLFILSMIPEQTLHVGPGQNR